jgi:hypothetical protein
VLPGSDAGLAPDDEHGLRGELLVRAGQRVRLVLEFRRPETLGEPGAPAAADVDAELEAAVAWWRAWSRRSTSQGPDAGGVLRSGLVLTALTYAPTAAMVAAARTSPPETPDGRRTRDYRYSWIRDAVMSGRSLVELGFDAEGVDGALRPDPASPGLGIELRRADAARWRVA